ncbi:MAG: hypothetical protein ACXVCM_04820, partial [Ktedonobacteraceae bacterium]
MMSQYTPPNLPLPTVRVRWWQSIRWRFALVSMLLVLLATALLAVSMIAAINYYYGVDVSQRLTNIAENTAQRIGVSDAQNGTLTAAVQSVLPTTPSQNAQNQDYLLLVINMNRPFQLIYPSYGNLKPGPGFTG